MNEILSIEIFGKVLFESDAIEFLGWREDKKKEWILANTNQRDESLIDEFVNNPKITKDCKCNDCGKHKEKTNGISEAISTEPTQSNEATDSSGNGERTVNKRRGNAKKS